MNLKSLFLLAAITGLAGCSAEQQAVETEAVIDALPDGAYLIAGVTVTENGEVSQYSRDQIKIIPRAVLCMPLTMLRQRVLTLVPVMPPGQMA